MNFTKDEQARRRSMLNQARTGNNQWLTNDTIERWDRRKRRDEVMALVEYQVDVRYGDMR